MAVRFEFCQLSEFLFCSASSMFVFAKAINMTVGFVFQLLTLKFARAIDSGR